MLQANLTSCLNRKMPCAFGWGCFLRWELIRARLALKVNYRIDTTTRLLNMERSLAFVALLVLCSFATLTSGAATHEGDRRGSFFHSGEYDEHIEVAKLTLKAATQCNYNTPTNDDL